MIAVDKLLIIQIKREQESQIEQTEPTKMKQLQFLTIKYKALNFLWYEPTWSQNLSPPKPHQGIPPSSLTFSTIPL